MNRPFFRCLPPPGFTQLKTIIPLNYNTIQHLINYFTFTDLECKDSKRKVNKTAQRKWTPVSRICDGRPFPLPTGKTLASKIASPVEQLFTRHRPIEEMLNCVEGFQQVRNSVGGLDFFLLFSRLWSDDTSLQIDHGIAQEFTEQI